MFICKYICLYDKIDCINVLTLHGTICKLISFFFRMEIQKYLLMLEEDIALNIPKKYWSIKSFNATLGHIANHSFKNANAKFDFATHPRFGSIRTIVSINVIKKGDEILCNYDYSENSIIPLWYANAYETEMDRKWPGKLLYNDEGLML